jgi:hypothetical protein
MGASLVTYVIQGCQRSGWNEGGHKADCKLLKDADLRDFFVVPWDQFVTRLSSPLNVTGNP